MLNLQTNYKADAKVVLASFYPYLQRYFDLHHTKVNPLEKVNPGELQLGTAAMTSLMYKIDQYGLYNIYKSHL